VKVVFVYRYLTLGGVEVVLGSRLAGLPAFGIQPALWFLSDGPGRSLWEPGEAGVRIGALPHLREYLDTHSVDVLSVIDTPEALAVAASVQHRPRVILEVHTPYPENRVYLKSRECGLAEVVLIPSEHQKAVVEREMPSAPRMLVVPNPIGAAFEAPLVDLDAGGAGPIVAWVGRLDRLKNWRGFLSIASRVLRQKPETEFWVVGAGGLDEEGEFERHCRRGGLQTRIRWLRGVPSRAMPRLLDGVRASGGVVVSTSRGESFGMAIAEAMARGCSVLAPRAGPFPEFISEGEEGSFYSPEKWSAAADRVLRLLEDGAERARMGAAARKRILATHGEGTALRALAEAIGRVPGVAGSNWGSARD
jgi:glycosyltransferase involved in cell wall biosynthesis